MQETLTKKNTLAEKTAKFFTDDHNLKLNSCIRVLSDLGATVFISQRVPSDPYAREITMARKSIGYFHTLSLSQIGIIMPGTENGTQNMYRFMLDEMRLVREEEGKEACIINLNNRVFFEANHAYFEPLSFLFHSYDAYEKLNTAPDTNTWIKKLAEQLKTNGGMELIAQWEKLDEEKNDWVRKQEYKEAAEVRDQQNFVLAKLQETLMKFVESEKI